MFESCLNHVWITFEYIQVWITFWITFESSFESCLNYIWITSRLTARKYISIAFYEGQEQQLLLEPRCFDTRSQKYIMASSWVKELRITSSMTIMTCNEKKKVVLPNKVESTVIIFLENREDILNDNALGLVFKFCTTCVRDAHIFSDPRLFSVVSPLKSLERRCRGLFLFVAASPSRFETASVTATV